MDDTLILFAWTLGGSLAFSLLGALFGGLVGWIHAREGNASGTRLGRKVAHALSRLVNQELTETQQGALIGAADGALFLGIMGTIFGLIAGRFAPEPRDWILPFFSITLLMVCGAIFFGFLALGMLRLRLRAVLGVFGGGMLGAFAVAKQFGVAHIVPGAVAGSVLGIVCAIALPRSWE